MTEWTKLMIALEELIKDAPVEVSEKALKTCLEFVE